MRHHGVGGGQLQARLLAGARRHHLAQQHGEQREAEAEFQQGGGDLRQRHALVRITVYSLLVASWVIATMPPISTASGISS